MQDNHLIINCLRHYTNGGQDFAVFRYGTCVLLKAGLSDEEAKQQARSILDQVFRQHPDMRPSLMDDDNILIQYNHPAVNIVLDHHAQEHWAAIDQNHRSALVTAEVLHTPLGPNVFDEFGKKALFGRCFLFMDAKDPEVVGIVRGGRD